MLLDVYVLFCIQNRLCTEKDVKAPNWYFSATDSNRIILTGEGISEIKQEVEQYINSQKLIYTLTSWNLRLSQNQ